MLIPYNTDAPLYHWPIATVGLIVVNVCVFMACTSAMNSSQEPQNPLQNVEQTAEHYLLGQKQDRADPWQQTIDPWILHYGAFHPWEWVTSNFIHGGFMHLLGNMAVLWGLGLIVEGKVGWWRFLLIFLAIGIGQCAVEQTLMLWASGGSSYGASAIVFGLVAIALVWAPRNDVNCILVLGYFWALDVSVMVYAGVVIAIEVLMAVGASLFFGSFTMSSAILHLLGAVLGAAIGVAMVKLKWVDCDGFDLLAVMAGREGQRRRRRDEPEEKLTPEEHARRREMALEQIRQLIAEGQPQLAYAAHQRMRRDYLDWHLPAGDFLKLIAAYLKQQLWIDAIPMMVQYLKNYDERVPQVRLQLAKVLIEHDDRPAQALRVMERIDSNQMDQPLRKVRDELTRKAQALKSEGILEARPEDW